jgi:hypothetical protein
MIARGETVTNSAEGANISCVNLSGKKTLAGRSSGECFLMEATKGESRLTGKLSGERTEKLLLKKGVFLSFFHARKCRVF